MNEIVIIAVASCIAILLIAFFSGIETAYSAANRLNIELKKKQGASSGILLSNLFDNPSRFIGVNIIGSILFLVIFVLLGNVSWNLLMDMAIEKLRVDDTIQPYLKLIRITMEIFLSWFIILVFGEFIPKAIFKTKSDSFLSFSARSGLLQFFDNLFYWISTLFVKLSIFILNVIFDMRIDRKKEAFTNADVDSFNQHSREYNEDGHDLNTELFENALSLTKVKVRECLVPRKEIEAIDISITIEEARLRFVETKLSKLVVYDGNIDHIKGYIHQLDLFKQPGTIDQVLLPIPAIPESMGATDLISKFSKERKSIAWVVDEFGGTAGIVTMEDLLEEIFGEIKDEFDVEEFEEKKISDIEYIFSGRLELDYLIEKYGLEFPEND